MKQCQGILTGLQSEVKNMYLHHNIVEGKVRASRPAAIRQPLGSQDGGCPVIGQTQGAVCPDTDLLGLSGYKIYGTWSGRDTVGSQ